jgi:hypothetical protein
LKEKPRHHQRNLGRDEREVQRDQGDEKEDEGRSHGSRQ